MLRHEAVGVAAPVAARLWNVEFQQTVVVRAPCYDVAGVATRREGIAIVRLYIHQRFCAQGG